MDKTTNQSMKHFFLFFILPFCITAQIRGVVQDSKNRPIPFVNIYLENSYTGTTSNENGSETIQFSFSLWDIIR